MRLSYQRSSSWRHWLHEHKNMSSVSEFRKQMLSQSLGKWSGQRFRVVGESQSPKRLRLDICHPPDKPLRAGAAWVFAASPGYRHLSPIWENTTHSCDCSLCTRLCTGSVWRSRTLYLQSTEMRSESLVQDHPPRDPQSALNPGSAQHPQYGNRTCVLWGCPLAHLIFPLLLCLIPTWKEPSHVQYVMLHTGYY